MLRSCVALGAAVVLLAGLAAAAETVKSGPQVGERVPGPFHPLNINGEMAGQKHCLFCQNGANPVAMVFAREASAPVVELIKKLDACTAKNGDCEMGSFVVFCSSEDGLEKKLKDVAKQAKLQKVILSIDNASGPDEYNVARDADVTVVLYSNFKVKANHAFKKGELKGAAVEKILGDVQKILPEK